MPADAAETIHASLKWSTHGMNLIRSDGQILVLYLGNQ